MGSYGKLIVVRGLLESTYLIHTEVSFWGNITKTRLFKYIQKYYHQKNWKFSDKNSDIFHISAQNIDCGYSLEPPRRVPAIYVLSRNMKNDVYPCKLQFYYIKVGFKGVKII